jgi:undecaprenyl diphosphate synthase
MNVSSQPLPKHLAVIMDGNGRWAERRHRPRSLGHRAGAKAVRVCMEFCIKVGIGSLTLFAFSSENWNRPAEEVGALMKLFLHMLDSEVDELHRRGVRITFIGEREDFSELIRSKMQRAEELTQHNRQLTMNIAAGYGGRADITQAARSLAQDAASGKINADSIDETLLGSRMSLSDQAAPDLFIRTGGDLRISNFLLWQLAYTEMWFTETLWPDLDEITLQQAIDDFISRERRFGLTSAQVTPGDAA